MAGYAAHRAPKVRIPGAPRYRPHARRQPSIQAAARRNANKAHILKLGMRGARYRTRRRP
jgi:hypothetical protein